MDFTYRPIVVWPGPLTRNRERSRFSASWNSTLKLLDSELAHLKARDVVLQVAMTDADIRLDGKLRAGSKAAHPGVILSFNSKHGPLAYPCDRFGDWQDNLRAIALSLEHLRAVDRYGVTKRGEQYRGWQALPNKADDGLPKTVDEAVDLLRRTGGGDPDFIRKVPDAANAAYRRAALATHPDRGGDAETFRRVKVAKEVMDKHFK